MLRLQLDSCGSLGREQATAVVSPDLRRSDTPVDVRVAATVAHPFVDDEGRISVGAMRVFDRSGIELEAQVVVLDSERDLALLHVAAPSGTATEGLPMRSWEAKDASVSMGRFDASDSPPTLTPVLVERRVEVTLDGDGRRLGLEVAGRIEPGDSGAPLIVRDEAIESNEVVGIMFAAKRNGDGGWAIDASELVSLAGERAPIGLVCPAP